MHRAAAPSYELTILRDDTMQLVHDSHASSKAYSNSGVIHHMFHFGNSDILSHPRLRASPQSSRLQDPSFSFSRSPPVHFPSMIRLLFALGVLLPVCLLLVASSHLVWLWGHEQARLPLLATSLHGWRWLRRRRYLAFSPQSGYSDVLQPAILFSAFREISLAMRDHC